MWFKRAHVVYACTHGLACTRGLCVHTWFMRAHMVYAHTHMVYAYHVMQGLEAQLRDPGPAVLLPEGGGAGTTTAAVQGRGFSRGEWTASGCRW